MAPTSPNSGEPAVHAIALVEQASVNATLYLTGSPRGAASTSNRVGAQVFPELQRTHPGAAMQPHDFVAPYLKHMLGFLGMTDVQVIDFEGTTLDAEVAERAIARGMKCAEAVAKEPVLR